MPQKYSIREVKEKIKSVWGCMTVSLYEDTYKSYTKPAKFNHRVYGDFVSTAKRVNSGIIPPGKIKNISGLRFGKLLVVGFSHSDGNGAFWRCRCDCGKYKVISSHALLRSTKPTRACGCVNGPDLIGKKVGRLVVLKEDVVRGLRGWQCKCKCGKIKSFTTGDLKIVKSCGCSHRHDMIGKKSGWLEVISFSHINIHAIWNCKCKCGKVIKAGTGAINSKHVKSCGCGKKYFFEKTSSARYGVKNPINNPKIALKAARAQNNSYVLRHWKTKEEVVCVASYEKNVVNYLNKNKINYEWQNKYFDVIVDGKKRKYRPDLYIVDENMWVEIKGYKRQYAMKKFIYFKNNIHKNTVMWDRKVLRKMKLVK